MEISTEPIRRPQRGRGSRGRYRDGIAAALGVDPQRKSEIYVELAISGTVHDPTYWLQLLFSCGVATLGLVLNSVAVIIGGMLISPLMGPILGVGLSLSSGDLHLGLRAGSKVVLSAVVAIVFSMLLVAALPFRELTPEITARTAPNTLDLVIALFSGAIGSIAIAKEPRGVVTSIPGVAIAVALMPPLCVVGYGFGLVITGVDGAAIASGGSLLFLTNLVAITFTALVVFFLLHVDTRQARAAVAEWRETDPESQQVERLLRRFPLPKPLQSLGTLPIRFLIAVVLLGILLVPLTQSYRRLTAQFAEKALENTVEKTTRNVWKEQFAQTSGGSERAHLEYLSVTRQGNRLTIYLKVLTVQPFTAAEKARLLRVLAARLDRSPESIGLQMIQTPIASAELQQKGNEALPVSQSMAEKAPVVTVEQLHHDLVENVSHALVGLPLPSLAQLIDYRVESGQQGPLRITLLYMSDRAIGRDAIELIAREVRSRISAADATIAFERLPNTIGPIEFTRAGAPATESLAALDTLAGVLQRTPVVAVIITTDTLSSRRERIGFVQRATLLRNRILARTGIDSTRIWLLPVADSTAPLLIQLHPADGADEGSPPPP